MKDAITDIQKKLSKITLQQQGLLKAFSDALAAGDIAKQAEIQRKLARLVAEMQRLGDEQRFAQLHDGAPLSRTRARITGKTLREQVLDALDELGVPVPPSTLSEFTQAIMGVEIAPSRFASLRRDEQNAAKRNIAAKPAWVVPAISASHLNAIPRLLTSSVWPLERRIIGARTLRANHLYVTLAFLTRYERLKAINAPQTGATETMVLRYARGIPGAVKSGSPINPDDIRRAAKSELSSIEAEDQNERREAAQKLNGRSEHQKLWGMPSLIDGAIREERVG